MQPSMESHGSMLSAAKKGGIWDIATGQRTGFRWFPICFQFPTILEWFISQFDPFLVLKGALLEAMQSLGEVKQQALTYATAISACSPARVSLLMFLFGLASGSKGF